MVNGKWIYKEQGNFMAIEQLDEKTSLDLMDGEFVIYKNFPMLCHKKGIFNIPHYNFVITSMRIALVPYKKKLEVVTINYEDIREVKPSFRKIQDNPNYGYNKKNTTATWIPLCIYMKDEVFFKRWFFPRYKFLLRSTIGEAFKVFGSNLLSELKEDILNLGQVMDYQARSNIIDSSKMSDYSKNEAKNEAWKKTSQEAKEWRDLNKDGKIKGGPAASHVAGRNIIVELVTAAIEEVKKQNSSQP